MNFLAHARLSFNQPELLVGNMISDFVKGNARFSYSEAVQRGIQLHRNIDRFTDVHPAVKEAKQYFAPAYRLYAGAFVDIVFDFFLANDIGEFPNEQDLMAFSGTTYTLLSSHNEQLPAAFREMLPYMIRQNWLYHYRFPEGIANSFRGLVRRAAYLSDADPAITVFREQGDVLRMLYAGFFPELKQYCLQQLEEI